MAMSCPAGFLLSDSARLELACWQPIDVELCIAVDLNSYDMSKIYKYIVLISFQETKFYIFMLHMVLSRNTWSYRYNTVGIMVDSSDFSFQDFLSDKQVEDMEEKGYTVIHSSQPDAQLVKDIEGIIGKDL